MHHVFVIRLLSYTRSHTHTGQKLLQAATAAKKRQYNPPIPRQGFCVHRHVYIYTFIVKKEQFLSSQKRMPITYTNTLYCIVCSPRWHAFCINHKQAFLPLSPIVNVNFLNLLILYKSMYISMNISKR